MKIGCSVISALLLPFTAQRYDLPGVRFPSELTATIVQQAAAPTAPPKSAGNERATAPAMPDAEGIYRVGNGVEKPTVVRTVAPEYTDIARRQKVNGFCLVELVVDAQGKPTQIHVVRSVAVTVQPIFRGAAETLDYNAVTAVSQYRFKPATYKGVPVPVRVTIKVDFRIY